MAAVQDSQAITGGDIPGATGTPAFTLTGTAASDIPILIAVPHAGRIYPGPVLERMRNPGFAAPRLEDRYVDLLAKEVAKATGAMLLVAHAPRAMIDLNRAADDIDWDMVAGGFTGDPGSFSLGKRARSGLGLIPRRLPGLGELWNRRHDQADLDARIAGIHGPYHAALADAMLVLRDRWGAALLLDMHSMPPLPQRPGQPAAEFVLGDRFGASCDGRLVGAMFAYFADMRCGAAHNRPYAGGYALERHAAPQNGLHAMQLEIDRSSYLDSRLAEPGAGFAAMAHLLTGMVRQLAVEVAALGQLESGSRWQEAAE